MWGKSKQMTDSQLIFGILQNDERAWRYICREMKPGFASILGQTFSAKRISNDDIDDIFQESLIVLMQRVKSNAIAISRDGALFSYLVQIGKFTACNMLRKKRTLGIDDEVTFSLHLHNIEENSIIAIFDDNNQLYYITEYLGKEVENGATCYSISTYDQNREQGYVEFIYCEDGRTLLMIDYPKYAISYSLDTFMPQAEFEAHLKRYKK